MFEKFIGKFQMKKWVFFLSNSDVSLTLQNKTINNEKEFTETFNNNHKNIHSRTQRETRPKLHLTSSLINV